MTTQDETLALARAWYQGDNTTFCSILKQIAAHTKAGSKRGDSAYIRALTVMSESTDTQLAEANTMIRQYVDTRPADTTHRLILPGEIREQIDRFIRERHEIGRLAAHGLAPASKILLTGAPGTGKTSLAREIAGRLGLPFAVIRLDRLIASRLGESLKNMGQLFDGLQHTPMVTLLDEADALLAQRGVGQDVAEMRRVTNLILQRLDQWDVRGVLVCATNLTAMLGPAALRRFDLRLDMPVADEQTAIAIIQSRLVELAMSVDDIAAMAACAAGLAPALIVQAVDTAARRTLLESDITMIDGGLLTGLMEQARVDTGEERRASDA